jgi:hypothetical protein
MAFYHQTAWAFHGFPVKIFPSSNSMKHPMAYGLNKGHQDAMVLQQFPYENDLTWLLGGYTHSQTTHIMAYLD